MKRSVKAKRSADVELSAKAASGRKNHKAQAEKLIRTSSAVHEGSVASDSRTRRLRRTDPGRRDRIIDSCLDVIAQVGVAGASHRVVARAADVPLGSMTYHFNGMDELLREAFTRFANSVADRFERRMAQAKDLDSARVAVVAIITEDIFSGPREQVLTHELYTLAARDPSFRAITTAWMRRSRAALEQFFDPETARMLDALIEGLSIHRALDQQPRGASEVVEAVNRITAIAVD
ncbi:TetR/AcrR family transcriptional regulator [Bifidobacterium tibiigranuli]|uniref:TetR/AcrR family transcriptional regulator n=1 Tax=Bifidobacterium tibiigranuli TaxID=2172043 RepID=UPI0026EDEA6B|nr:TetR family transcriptional regulator [Bifidobacterium tibiigranuli]MCI2186606.1 TetR family transcriptional regulator [Bifidobacterium tibiigranuli]MCI2204212.1 TetR family transcriptional regulator [Bifidobacterium tibiigranuli]